MTAIRTILHPHDFSAGARNALRVALDVAERYEAELLVAHAVDDEYAGAAVRGSVAQNPTRKEESDVTPTDVETRLRDTVEEVFEARRSAPSRDVVVQYRTLRRSSPSDAILDYATAQATDVIVMGTRGLRGVRRLLLGSVAANVLHSARCDVVTVPPDAMPASKGRVLVPLDMNERSFEVVRRAADVARHFESDMDLLHVLERPAAGSFTAAGALPPMREVVEARLRDMIARAEPTPAVAVHVQEGSPAETIRTFVDGHDVRFVVMASAGMTPAEQLRRDPGLHERIDDIPWVLGSITERIATHARTHVWVLKRFEDTSAYPAGTAPSYGIAR